VSLIQCPSSVLLDRPTFLIFHSVFHHIRDNLSNYIRNLLLHRVFLRLTDEAALTKILWTDTVKTFVRSATAFFMALKEQFYSRSR
jgi:hypothetical protein